MPTLARPAPRPPAASARPHCPRHRPPRPGGATLALACAAAFLQACGGGDDDAPAAPPAPAAISGVVADGPLQGATVCYDTNDSGACDSGEPGATTDAEGRYSFSVDAALAGKHAVVAQVPATAVDKDTGQPVGAAFTLLASATGTGGAQTVFVSPLTTVVAHTAADGGIGTAAAAAQVQAQLGLATSPLADFTAPGAAPELGLAARAVGRVMIDTAKLSADAGLAADQATQLVREAATTQLPVLASALEASAASQAPVAQRVAEAAQAVAVQLNLSPATVKAVAEVVTQPTVAADPPGPFVSVRRFTYTDAGNYSYQLFIGDASQTDADGAWIAHEPRATLVNGEAIPFSRNQLYWTGSDWHDCDNGHAVVRTRQQTDRLPQRSTYCGGSQSEGRVVWEDIGGKTLRDVVTRMRAFPLRDNPGSTTDASGLPVKWGPDPALLPAGATFPAGARLTTRRSRGELGGTDRIETAVRPTIRHADGVFRQAATLEQLSLMSGNLATADAVVTNQNTLFVDDVPLDSQPDAALEAFKRWRLAVDVASLKGRFYRCDVLKSSGTSQACEARGDATLAVQTQGGIRLLRVAAGYPAELTGRMQRQRFWAEHMGTVFRGSTDLERSFSDQRLNKPAWDALRTALGIPEPVTPAAPVGKGPFTLLRDFRYTDARNYSWRLYTGDDSVVNGDGVTVVNETRRTVSGGADVPFRRHRAFWSGSAWVDCADSGPVLTAQVDAPRRSTLCQGYVDEETAALRISLGGRLMGEVVNEIRSYAATETDGVTWAQWGMPVSRVAALATTRFPAGAALWIRGGRSVAVPEAIATNPATDRVRVAPGATSSVPFADWPLATTLEQVVAGYPGNLAGNVVNGNTTLFVWRFTEAPTSPEWTDQVEIRVAFDANGNKARFTRNNRLVNGGASTNFQTVLDTTYTIEQVGDVRLLKFAAMPAGFGDRFGFARRYAQRDGAVWYAFKDQVPADRIGWTQRLNGTAWDALRAVLGIG